MITIIEGNILNATEDIITHSCNCKGVMGGGLAKQIRDKYPVVFTKYKERCDKYGSKNLGRCQIVYNKSDGKTIANIFGQDGFGRDKQYTDYEALKSGLNHLESFARNGNLSVAVPYGFGSGLGGGDWNIVESIISDVFFGYKVTLYKFN